MAITRFETGVSCHFRLFKDDVLKIELWVPLAVWLGLGVFSANLRLRVWWLSHLVPALTIFSLPRNTPCSHSGYSSRRQRRLKGESGVVVNHDVRWCWGLSQEVRLLGWMCPDRTQCRQGSLDTPDATRCGVLVQDAQDAQDAGSRLGESGCNTTGSDPGHLFADVSVTVEPTL